jgi:hypothetical protein
MLKIKANKVEDVTEYDVEPKIATLYYVDRYRKGVIKVENCIFKEATPVVYGASDAKVYRLSYENGTLFRDVIIDITTGVVKEKSYHFFDYEQAVSIYKKLRIEYLKNIIDGLKDAVARLKKYQKELKELENFEKKVVVKNKDE